MADNPYNNSSYFQRTVVLRDWWLIKCSKEFEGKRFGVAGNTQIAERGAVRVFTSSPIITAFDVFTLQASDGVCIILRGFLNQQRLAQSGFLPEISREFIFGFPPCWEAKCNDCFVGVPSINSVINKASRTILSPCKWNLEDGPAVLVDKDGHGGGSAGRDEKPARKKSLRLLSKSVEASKVKNKTTSDGSEGNERKLDETNIVKKRSNGRDHVIEALDKAKSSDASEVQNPTTNDGSEGLNKVKGNGVERDECMDNEEISPVDGCGKMHSGTNSKKITSKNAATLTSEQRKVKQKVTETSLHSLSKEVSDSSKSGKNGKSKKSEKILKDDLDVVVEPMTHPGSKVKDKLSLGKTIRKIDFDEEVTPEKDGKKQIISASADSLGQKRSRSGRLLVSSLEYWRNQVPVYDADRNLIQVNEGHQTNSAPSKGKGSVSRKPRR